MTKKKKIIIIVPVALVLMAVVFFCVFNGIVTDNNTQRASVTKSDNITILNLTGSWFEMGRQYGKLAQEQLQDVLAFCMNMIEAKEGNYDSAVSIIDEQTEQERVLTNGVPLMLSMEKIIIRTVCWYLPIITITMTGKWKKQRMTIAGNPLHVGTI